MYLAVSRVGIRIVHVFGMYSVRAVRIHATIHDDTCIEGKLSLFRGKTVPCPLSEREREQQEADAHHVAAEIAWPRSLLHGPGPQLFFMGGRAEWNEVT